MSRVLVLREREAAEETALVLRHHGHDPLLLPVQEAVPLDAEPPAGDFAALLVTSRNALPLLARHRRSLPDRVLAVGPATAERLAALGFHDIEAGAGSAESLIGPAADLARRAGRPLLLALGRVRRPVLEEGLRQAGIAFVLWETYDMRTAEPDPAIVRSLIADGPADAVLLLSEGQAQAFSRLQAAVPDLLAAAPRLLCLSSRIAAALPEELRPHIRTTPDRTLGALFEFIASTKFT